MSEDKQAAITIELDPVRPTELSSSATLQLEFQNQISFHMGLSKALSQQEQPLTDRPVSYRSLAIWHYRSRMSLVNGVPNVAHNRNIESTGKVFGEGLCYIWPCTSMGRVGYKHPLKSREMLQKSETLSPLHPE